MGRSRNFRKRIDAISRGREPEPGGSDKNAEQAGKPIDPGSSPLPGAILYRRDVPLRAGTKRRRWSPPVGEPVILEEVVPGVEVRSPRGGKAYFVAMRLCDLAGRWHSLCDSFGKCFAHTKSGLHTRLSRVCEPQALLPQDVMFMDIETTGLSNTALFLIGTMEWEGGDLAVRQLLARNYAEEPAVISLFRERLADKKLLVTFNGKSFDLPYVRVRAAATGVEFGAVPPHFDLLHECRRAWGGMLPDCRLQTLESRICGRPRLGDIPGNEIPEAYHAFVRTGNAAQIVDILKHNALDLATMAELMLRFPAGT